MITKQEYLDIYDVAGIAMEVYNTLDAIISDHRAQLFNYMRIANQKKGILINFGEKRLRTERYIFNKDSDRFVLLSKDNYKQHILPDS